MPTWLILALLGGGTVAVLAAKKKQIENEIAKQAVHEATKKAMTAVDKGQATAQLFYDAAKLAKSVGYENTARECYARATLLEGLGY